MLKHLSIRNFVIVDSLDLDFAVGMIVLTGETGAGKSILLDALGLCLGDRADSLAVREGAERSEVSAAFDVRGRAAVEAWLAEHELEADGECLIRRTIGRDGRSKAWINGQMVPLQSLREIGEQLVDIHGQHAHQSLMRRDAQRELLDGYAGLDARVQELTTIHSRWRSLRDEFARLSTAQDERQARIDLLRYQLGELDALALQPGEVARVEDEHRRLANSTRLMEGGQRAALLLDEDDHSAVSLLNRALSELRDMERFDEGAGSIVQVLDGALIQAREAASELRRYRDRLDLEPDRLDVLDQRLAAIHNLARKHRVEGEELLAVQARLSDELAGLEGADARREGMEQDIANARTAYMKVAGEITKARAKAAEKLAKAVTGNIHELGMGSGRLEVQLQPLTEEDAGPAGMERVEFLVAANAGQTPRSLAKVASGGELSRISLAIQVLTAGAAIPTLIFDEVDVGIGGGVAEMVGRQLHKLAEGRQVLCVTHQPQVAALGDHHFVVSKKTIKGATTTSIEPVGGAARVDEVARMLGGIEITAKTRSHARELIERSSG